MIKTNNGKQRGSWGGKRTIKEPFNNYSSAGDKNYTGVLIGFLVIGITILLLTCLWESSKQNEN